jgi:hypothetical protein
LIIAGLPMVDYAEAASSSTTGSWFQPQSSSKATENSVLELAKNHLGVSLTSTDISIAHRLRKKSDGSPPAVIVLFTNRNARDSMYAARHQLKSVTDARIYINEDLTKRRLTCSGRPESW